MHLALYSDAPSSQSCYAAFERGKVLPRLRTLDSRARRKGLESLDPSRNPLIRLGMEVDAEGRVTKNSYGVFNLAWQSEHHSEWPSMIESEAGQIRSAIHKQHGVPLRFLIWAGMGGSAEDKAMYLALGLLKGSPRCYVLDSTDPAKLSAILGDITARSRGDLSQGLKSSLVVGMAMGMTSYEPVLNLEKLALLYDRERVDARANFLYMTLPGSILDQFASGRGFRRVELQPDNRNSTAGRHSGPLTRGSLYPLALCGADLRGWMEATQLSEDDIATALRLAAFLHTQGAAGRDKVTLLMPKEWAGASVWTKQDFEESLGKSEELGIKILIGETPRLASYRPPKDPKQDRVFWAVAVKGKASPGVAKIAALRRAGYPVAVLTLPRDAPLSRYMQFVHYVVFGIAFHREMTFVTQPSVELYKAITARLFAEANEAGGVEKTGEWQSMMTSPRQARWRGRLTLHYDRLACTPAPDAKTAPGIYASLLKQLAAADRVEYGELTFFGDTRYSDRGRALHKCLDRAAESVFRRGVRMPVDVYEGPAMNHSYHEMIIGHGRCFSTVLLSLKEKALAAAGYTSAYHRAQFLATQMALAERGRAVVAITLEDLGEASLKALDEFFRQVAAALK